MRRNILLFFIPALLSVIGCDIVNPDESVPTYVNINAFDLVVADPSVQGSDAHNITNVWMYYNNDLIGVYDLPCEVPVITEGEKGDLALIPGITLNGLVALQPQYPFYRVDTMVLTSKPGGVVNVQPVTSYLAATKFRYKEDFEVGNSFEPFVTGPSISRTTDATYVFEGAASGVIELSANENYSESICKTGFPIAQGDAFLELNYKCSVPFEVGLYNTLDSGPETYQYLFGVKASGDVWKKIYIELASFTGANKGKDHKVMFKTSLPEGSASGYVALDNIKVVSF